MPFLLSLSVRSADSSQSDSDAAEGKGDHNDRIGNDSGSSSLRPSAYESNQSHERSMEALSAEGAARIAQLSIPERAKRAMLAEAVEDQIFANTEQLEILLLKTNYGRKIDCEDESDPEENRNYAVELAQQTRTLQVQYRELVMGESSSVLNALESVIGGSNSGSNTGD